MSLFPPLTIMTDSSGLELFGKVTLSAKISRRYGSEIINAKLEI